jgi:hypothetical protein
MTRGQAPRDLIEAYLDELRGGLRVLPGEAEMILAEAEDHLRETAAAGLAIGMTELEAQEAAISSFGPIRAVTRAHLARATGGPAVLANVVMTAWKLVSLLLLAGGASGMAIVVVTGFARRGDRSRPDVHAGSRTLPGHVRPSHVQPGQRGLDAGGRLGRPASGLYLGRHCHVAQPALPGLARGGPAGRGRRGPAGLLRRGPAALAA